MASISRRQAIRALVTRPREAAEALASALAARGIEALIEPMLRIHFREAAIDLGGAQAILCTSAHGVRALALKNGDRDIPLFVVGEATAARARSEGFTSVTSAGGDVADLVGLAAERLRPCDGRLLHVCGSVVAGNLVGELGARGFAVERKILYDALPIPALSTEAIGALRAGDIDFAFFFSPRTAAIFVRRADAAGLRQSCKTASALSISTATDTAVGGLSWQARMVAERPDQPALLGLLDRRLAEQRNG